MGNRGTRPQSQFDAERGLRGVRRARRRGRDQLPARAPRPADQAARARPRHRLPVLDRHRRARPGPARLPRLRLPSAPRPPASTPTGSSTPGRASGCWRGPTDVDSRHGGRRQDRPAARGGGTPLASGAAAPSRRTATATGSSCSIPASLTRGRRPSGSRRWWPGSSGPSARRRPTDDDLMERALRAQRRATSAAWPSRSRCAGSTTSSPRWGSCTPGDRTIRLSARLQGMPAWVVDYVLVHELAHLIEPGHDAAFWAWVDRYPQAERAKGYLLGWSAAAQRRRRPTATSSRRPTDREPSSRLGSRARAAGPTSSTHVRSSGRAARRPATSARRATPR